MATNDWQIEWHTDWDLIWDAAFQRKWRRILDRSAASHAFFEPSVVHAWYDAYRDFEDIEARFLIATHGERGRVFLPLAITRQGWKHAWLRVLSPVGSNEFDYQDPIAEEPLSPASWASFWEALENDIHTSMPNVDVFNIPRMRQAVTAVPAKGVPVNDIDAPRFTSAGAAPWINLANVENFDDLLKRLPSQHRQDVRRQRRRLSEIGDLNLRVFQPDETDAALEILPRFVQAHQSRWPNAFRAAGFYENLIRHALPAGQLHLSELNCGDQSISWHMGFKHRSRFYYYLPAFDQSMRKHSPGKVHLALLLEEAIDQNSNVFDMLVGTESYKTRWASGQAELVGIRRVTPSVSASAKDYLTRRVRPSIAAARRKFKRSA